MNIYIPLLAVFISYIPQSFWMSGVVRSVQDADTVTIQFDNQFESVRLVYIDAPELAQGDVAKEGSDYLRKTVLGRRVRVRVVGRGFYGRVLGEIFTDKSINLLLVARGHAFLYPWSSFLNYQQKLKYLSARDQSRKLKIGVWRQGVRKPWLFRKDLKRKRKRKVISKAHRS